MPAVLYLRLAAVHDDKNGVRTDGERLEAVLPPASWNVIQLTVSA